MSFKLLCCDGGGIRGLITALLIQDLDRRYGVIEKADGFAGTSTGGLIALALANDVPLARIIDVYRNEGGKIFLPNGWLLEDKRADVAPPESVGDVEQLLGAGPGIFSCQYTNTGLHGIAQELLGDTPLSATNRKLVAINTARLWDGTSWQAETFSNVPANPYRDLRMADAALATSAAPTYFPPYAIGNLGFFADGGTFANNPSVAAVAEVLSGGLADHIADIRLLSLGTGTTPQGIPPSAVSKPLDWGVTDWMWPVAWDSVPATALLNLILDCTAQAATTQAARMLGAGFCRGNFVLSQPVGLDDWQDVDKLEAMTGVYMKSSDWQAVRDWVAANW